MAFFMGKCCPLWLDRWVEKAAVLATCRSWRFCRKEGLTCNDDKLISRYLGKSQAFFEPAGIRVSE